MALSRVKKYEDLRKSIELDQIDVDTNNKTTKQETSDILKAFDSTVFKRSDIQDEIQAKRKKTTTSHAKEDSVEIKTKDSFTNEYLDDFMKEVREYNIKKGNRDFEDTEVDILHQLHPSARQKRAHYVEEIKDEVNKQENEMIALEVASLLDDVNDIDDEIVEEVINEIIDEKNDESNTSDEVVEKKVVVEEDETTIENQVVNKKSEYIDETKLNLLNKEELDEVKDQLEEVKEQNKDNHERLLDETLKMKKQLNDYEEELNDLNKGVVKTNKLLNFIFIFLILVFLCLVGYLIYLIYNAGVF